MSKPHHILKSRAMFLAGVTLLLVVLGIVTWIMYSNRSSAVGFQQYEPKTLPPDTRITGRTLEIWSQENAYLRKHKLLRLNLNTPHSSILEEKDTGREITCDDKADNQTCQMVETAPHQKYRILTTHEDTLEGKVVGQEVALLKGDTYIVITLNDEATESYTQDMWDKVVDSFMPVHYNKGEITVRQYKPGP